MPEARGPSSCGETNLTVGVYPTLKQPNHRDLDSTLPFEESFACLGETKKRRIRRESRILLVLIGGQPIGVGSRIGLERWAAATDTVCRIVADSEFENAPSPKLGFYIHTFGMFDNKFDAN
ncbi:hypothetical protein FBZ98_104430 [Rhizobium sp. ERR 922]|nr:hypothetical protein FBZ98_104430 [Rhizobium sp. ERR 922]TWB95533.1 hypothetical protein FBZ97_104221 [Rhizobium sp. ERR 942]